MSVTVSLPTGVRGWLRLLLVALPGLFCLPFTLVEWGGGLFSSCSEVVFPSRDKFINALLKFASKRIPQFLDIYGSKVRAELRLKVLHGLFKLVPFCFL